MTGSLGWGPGASTSKWNSSTSPSFQLWCGVPAGMKTSVSGPAVQALAAELELHLAVDDVVELVDGWIVVGGSRGSWGHVAADHAAALAAVEDLELIALSAVGGEVDGADVSHAAILFV